MLRLEPMLSWHTLEDHKGGSLEEVLSENVDTAVCESEAIQHTRSHIEETGITL